MFVCVCFVFLIFTCLGVPASAPYHQPVIQAPYGHGHFPPQFGIQQQQMVYNQQSNMSSYHHQQPIQQQGAFATHPMYQPIGANNQTDLSLGPRSQHRQQQSANPNDIFFGK